MLLIQKQNFILNKNCGLSFSIAIFDYSEYYTCLRLTMTDQGYQLNPYLFLLYRHDKLTTYNHLHARVILNRITVIGAYHSCRYIYQVIEHNKTYHLRSLSCKSYKVLSNDFYLYGMQDDFYTFGNHHYCLTIFYTFVRNQCNSYLSTLFQLYYTISRK